MGLMTLSLPDIGFGTYRLIGSDGAEAIASAIDAGYRLIDSAYSYENEGTVGEGVRRAVDSGVPRDSLIITSKLPGRYQESGRARKRIEESIFRLGVDHLDLLLIHWPNPEQDHYVEAWQQLIEARNDGLVHHIGVSNFLPEHIERLEDETGELPVVNQIELHPYFPQVEQVDYHREKGILTEAWSPLGRGKDILEDPVITEIAEARGVGAGEIVLSWHHARGVTPIPRSANPERQRSNLAAVELELSEGEIEAITGLGRADGRLNGQNPATHEEL